MYVSKAKMFILLTSANYGLIYLIDFTHTVELSYFHSTGQNCIFYTGRPYVT